MALQNHIHLSDTLGGAPENAPNKTWATRRHIERPTVLVNLKRTTSGKLRPHILSSAGNPVQFRDYEIEVSMPAATLESDLTTLRGLNGKVVYFVPQHHANDGADHTADVRQVFCEVQPFEFQNDDPLVQNLSVTIQLTDADTVT